jgi:hypothetical protein
VFQAEETISGKCWSNKPGEFWWAIHVVEKALEKIKQAGKSEENLRVAVDELDRAAHYVRCAANGLLHHKNRKEDCESKTDMAYNAARNIAYGTGAK